VHESLTAWIGLTSARVVNPMAAMGSNGSKPYQAQLIARHGFRVAETLITNEPTHVIDFHRRHGRVIYKSASGIRSIVRLLGPDDLDRLERIRWCPTQFQAYVSGIDVRVHVVDGEVFASEITARAIDYRYASREGDAATLSAVSLGDDVASRYRAEGVANFWVSVSEAAEPPALRGWLDSRGFAPPRRRSWVQVRWTVPLADQGQGACHARK